MIIDELSTATTGVRFVLPAAAQSAGRVFNLFGEAVVTTNSPLSGPPDPIINLAIADGANEVVHLYNSFALVGR